MAEIVFSGGFFLPYFIEEFVHHTCDVNLHFGEANYGGQSAGVFAKKDDESSEDPGDDRDRKDASRSLADISRQLESSATSNKTKSLGTNSLSPQAQRLSTTKISNGDTVKDKRDGNSAVDLEQPQTKRFCSSSSVKILLAVAALSSHAVFEGLIVGLESTTSGVWAMFFGKMFLQEYCAA